MKQPFIIYSDLESLIEKTDGCRSNPVNLSEAIVSEHISWDFSVSTITSFKNIENKHDVYRGKDCMWKFCEFLREHAMGTINLKKWSR